MVQIIVEGRDSLFIEAYLNHLYPNRDKALFKVVSAGGFTKLKKLKNELDENIRIDKGINLVIFDTDDSSKDYGGLTDRKKYLDDLKASLNIAFEYFLFPNNAEDGDFETLLENTAKDEHKCLFSCFDGYQTCVDGHRDENDAPIYNTPIRKSKIYAYVEAIKKSRKQKERFKNKDFLFDNPDIWNLEAGYLDPLKEFLESHIDNYLSKGVES